MTVPVLRYLQDNTKALLCSEELFSFQATTTLLVANISKFELCNTRDIFYIYTRGRILTFFFNWMCTLRCLSNFGHVET